MYVLRLGLSGDGYGFRMKLEADHRPEEREATRVGNSADLSHAPEPRLLSKVDLARFLGVSCRTVEEYQRRGLPFFRISARRNRYDLAAVRAWLERRCLVVRLH